MYATKYVIKFMKRITFLIILTYPYFNLSVITNDYIYASWISIF